MSQWVRAAVLALLAGGCVGRTAVENTPPPTPRPPESTLLAAPMPVEAAQEAPTPPPPRPRPNPNPGPNSPPGGPCGSPSATMERPSNGANLTASPVSVQASAGSGVVRIDFYYHVDAAGLRDPAVLIDSVTGSPWRTSWRLPGICTSSVRVFGVAWDNCGNARESASVSVRVCP